MIIQPVTISKDCKVIKASYNTYKEWRRDPRGYFTIKPFVEEGIIRARFHNYRHEVLILIESETAEALYNTIVREQLVTSLQHAAYLGFELAKAEIALKENLHYNQDDALDFTKTN